MRKIMISLGLISLMLLNKCNVTTTTTSPTEKLPPLDESMVQVHWLSEGEVSPFDGILLNEYTYKRLMLKTN